jgi:prepilin-type N-terminal cleavage/methylation domain-containing protein
MTRSRGFTMIELLVVISIMSILSGLLMPMVVLARKRAAESNTLALLRKVETGLELFKGELDTYPFQAHSVFAAFPEADNHLAWVLAHDLDQDEHQALNLDLSAARAAYTPGGAHAVTEP